MESDAIPCNIGIFFDDVYLFRIATFQGDSMNRCIPCIYRTDLIGIFPHKHHNLASRINSA